MARTSEGGGKKQGPADRRERLEAELRANLQRRKAQARARAAGDEAGGADPAAVTGGDDKS